MAGGGAKNDRSMEAIGWRIVGSAIVSFWMWKQSTESSFSTPPGSLGDVSASGGRRRAGAGHHLGIRRVGSAFGAATKR